MVCYSPTIPPKSTTKPCATSSPNSTGDRRARAVPPASRWKNSYTFVLLEGDTLRGCARIITDTVTAAYIEDVVVDDQLRGRGVGQWMMQEIMNCPAFAEQHRWLLMTVDAQTFYQKLGSRRWPTRTGPWSASSRTQRNSATPYVCKGEEHKPVLLSFSADFAAI